MLLNKGGFRVCVCVLVLLCRTREHIFDICDICVSVCVSKGNMFPITPALLLLVEKYIVCCKSLLFGVTSID